MLVFYILLVSFVICEFKVDFVFNDRIVIGCIILLKCKINIILKNWFLVEKKCYCCYRNRLKL